LRPTHATTHACFQPHHWRLDRRVSRRFVIHRYNAPLRSVKARGVVSHIHLNINSVKIRPTS
jgi:hypothetical protein